MKSGHSVCGNAELSKNRARAFSHETLEPRLQYRLDVGREGREAVDEVPDLGCGDAMLDRQCEDVDQLLTGVAEEMRANDAICFLVDEHFRPRRRQRVGAA